MTYFEWLRAGPPGLEGFTRLFDLTVAVGFGALLAFFLFRRRRH